MMNRIEQAGPSPEHAPNHEELHRIFTAAQSKFDDYREDVRAETRANGVGGSITLVGPEGQDVRLDTFLKRVEGDHEETLSIDMAPAVTHAQSPDDIKVRLVRSGDGEYRVVSSQNLDKAADLGHVIEDAFPV